MKPTDPSSMLSAAGTRLVLDRPFLGALALRLSAHVGGEWCKTVGTDARALYYNPDYISALSISQLEAVLAHEALHCALSHFARRHHRERHRWDLACDFAINALLVSEGMTLPPNAVYLPEFEGMTAEEIYPLIDEHPDVEPHDQHLYDGVKGDAESGENSSGGAGANGAAAPPRTRGDQPPPLSLEERDILSSQWQQRATGAAQQALQSGHLSQQMARLIDHLLQCQVPWRAMLARFMSFSGREDFNYHRPSRREGEAILPSLRSAQVEIVVAVDTSGSITSRELGDFIGEIDALKGQVRARVTLLACDAALHPDAPWRFEPWENLQIPALGGGGGTRFTPVFDWLDTQDHLPDALVYFTDADGEFPPTAPACPVVWLVKGRHPVPFGERIQLNS
jgi:predicted metal-dependent peptidase